MLTINDLKSGSHIELNDEPYEVLSKEFIKSAQRRPVMSCKLRNLISGKVLKHTFQQSDAIAQADLEKIQTQYLYKDAENYYFMDNESYEQFSLPSNIIDNKGNYFIEGAQITILKFKEKPISISLPIKMAFKVKSAPPGIRGDTAQGGTKEVIIETGAKVKVPLFIKEGQKIIIDTRDGSYVEKITE
ncbi:MAG: elongation factor P [Patescibacteria group bacterium]